MKEREYRALNKMLRYLSDYKRESVLAPLFKMLEATFDLFVPLVMADIVNVGIAAHDFHYILVRCGILLLLVRYLREIWSPPHTAWRQTKKKAPEDVPQTQFHALVL